MESDLQTSNGRKICIYQDSPGFIGPVDIRLFPEVYLEGVVLHSVIYTYRYKTKPM